MRFKIWSTRCRTLLHCHNSAFAARTFNGRDLESDNEHVMQVGMKKGNFGSNRSPRMNLFSS